MQPSLWRVRPLAAVWTSLARRAELRFWRGRPDTIGDNKREWVCTAFFGIERSWYRGRRILDVGCGPRGTLDWATEAAARVGLDPLADAYVRELGADARAMEYVTGDAERMPFADRSFDVVTCVNALDHVRDPARAAAEMARVLEPGGTLLLVTDVGHRPRLTEPHTFGPEVLDLFAGAFEVEQERMLAPTGTGIDDSLRAGLPYRGDGPAVLAARLRRAGA